LRFLDIAVAALVGTSAISGILLWSPRQGDTVSAEFAVRTQLREELLGVLQSRGFAWLIQSPPGDVCAVLESMSNSSVSFSATLGASSCPLSPPTDSVSVSISLRLLPMAVTLEAWSRAQG
jgi:hypothetical protein